MLRKYFTTKRKARAMQHRILAVDDDDKILKVISTLLRREGFEIETESNPEVGLQRACSEKFDLVILDVMMPLLNGYEFYDRLRECEHTQGLPVLLLTAKGKYDVIHDRTRYFLYGLYGVLTKPFYGRELIQKVWDILSVARGGATGSVDEHLTPGETQSEEDEDS